MMPYRVPSPKYLDESINSLPERYGSAEEGKGVSGVWTCQTKPNKPHSPNHSAHGCSAFNPPGVDFFFLDRFPFPLLLVSQCSGGGKGSLMITNSSTGSNQVLGKHVSMYMSIHVHAHTACCQVHPRLGLEPN